MSDERSRDVDWSRFALVALASWRVTHLLAREDGPADIVYRLRARLGASAFGGLMDCFACLSVWVCAPASMLITRRPADAVLTWLALSGAICLLETALERPRGEEHHHGMLWTEAGLAASAAGDAALPDESSGPAGAGAS